MNIAIIGSGISGLVAANILKDYANITIFEKSRGVGGRLSTRRMNQFSFNHGAPYFTAQTKIFYNFLQNLFAHNIIDNWKPELVEIDLLKNKEIKNLENKSFHYKGIEVTH